VTQAPDELVTIQKWFSHLITRKLTRDHKIQPVTEKGVSIVDEAKLHITPSKTLEPHARLEIYNQGYWWRLSDALIGAFPLVARLFGAGDFHHSLVVPYLEACLPDHWDMNLFGRTFVEWLETNYLEKDRLLVLLSAKVDWAMQVSFFAKEEKPLDNNALSNIAELSLALQPHVKLLELPYDLFTFRSEFLKHDVNYGIDNDFPPLEKAGPSLFFTLSRNTYSRIEYRQVTEAEFLLWKWAEQGKNITEIANEFEKIGGNVYEDAKVHIGKWLQEGIGKKWLIYSIRSASTSIR